MKKWKIKHIFNLEQDKLWRNGYFHFGFHDKKGNRYLLQWDEHWLGHLTQDDKFIWTAGSINKGLSNNHIYTDIRNPHYVCESGDGALILSSNGNGRIYKVFPDQSRAELFIDTGKLGIKDYDTGNCVVDSDENIWVNDIRGCKVWQFDETGELIRSLGNGTPGFQKEPVSFDNVRFNWVYDIRLGPDGNIYVLDSKNYAVRKIDIGNELVTTVVGTGESGDTGDGGDALEATLGSNPDVYFDGPISLALDEEGNMYIGDAQNHILRMVDSVTNVITTIAGKRNAEPHKRNNPGEKDPLQLNLPQIASLEYYNHCLILPENGGDTVILEEELPAV